MHLILHDLICRGHSQFGYCQAGTSGLLLEDDSVVIGSPGSYNWKGNIFLNSVSDEYLHGDYKWYHSPIRDAENSPIASLSYLGNNLLYYIDQYMMCYSKSPISSKT